MRLRRLMGASVDRIAIGAGVVLDLNSRLVYVDSDSGRRVVNDIQGMKFEILRELAAAWHRSPGELVPFSHLERFSEGEDPRASLRVRIREIKDTLGRALGVRFGSGELIINVRDKGYRLTPPQS